MMFLLIIFLPLLSSIISGIFSFYIGQKGSIFVTVFNMFLTWLFSCILFYNLLIYGYQYYLITIPWIYSGLFECNWGFLYDSLTIVMLFVVNTVSLLVHIYSIEYMEGDPHHSRFMSYLSLFTFFMVILITSDNYLQMFVGWEGVGLCSYLLINFWFTRLQANKSSIKAMLVNRVSDLSLMLGLLTIFASFKTLDYKIIFSSITILYNFYFQIFNYIFYLIDIISLLLFIGAMGKSAQIFLHIWLPDAMEGPTPVSALIHAATMVTAGVFLIARSSPILEYSPFILKFIVIIGSLTAFIASTIALVQNDIKRIIAYSTCSQLGYMFFISGLSSYNLSIFHLYNHAFFKALLFLSAGSVIHGLSDEQDIRKMGGLKNLMPFTYIVFVIGSLALAGFPFLAGFYSKDVILEITYSSYSTIGYFSYCLGTISAFFTSCYSTRLIYFVFLKNTNAFKKTLIYSHEPGLYMLIPLFILSLGSIFIGFLSKDSFIGMGSPFWNNSIFIRPGNIKSIDSEYISFLVKLIPTFFSFFGIILTLCLYEFKIYKNLFKKFFININYVHIYNFLNKKWFFDKLYNEFISQSILNISYKITYKIIDKGIIEFFGPKGFSFMVYNFSSNLIKMQTGFIYHYILIIFSGLIFLNLIINYNFYYFYIFYLFFLIFFI